MEHGIIAIVEQEIEKWEDKKLENKEKKWVCAYCGYTADGKFEGDICPQCGLTYWRCAKCGFTITAARPPEVCPECKTKSGFLNVTCYTPECGGPRNIDTRLYKGEKYTNR